MTPHDWNSLKRSRWTTVAVILVAAVVLFFLRSNQRQTLSRGWSLYSVGYILSPKQTPELTQAAPWLRLPKALASLAYGGAVLHPEGARGVAFGELLYGSMPRRYVDVVESQTPVAVGIAGRRESFGAAVAKVGAVRLRGVRRQFALFKHAGLYYVVVAPEGSAGFQPAVSQLVR